MTPAQRTELAAIARRGYLPDAGNEMIRLMQQIDERRTKAAAEYRHGQAWRAARHSRTLELVAAAILIIALLAVAVLA